MRIHLLRCLPFVLATVVLPASAHAHVGQVHEHGVSRLDLVLDGNALQLSLEGPGHNFVGFEHEPSTDAERDLVQKAVTMLRDPATQFAFTEAADCALDDVTVSAEHARGEGAHHDRHAKEAGHGTHGRDHGHAGHRHAGADKHGEDDARRHVHENHHVHEHHHDHGPDGHAHEHNDWRVEYALTCAVPAALRQIQVSTFEAFEQTQEIRFQALTPAGQTGGTLTADSATIRLP